VFSGFRVAIFCFAIALDKCTPYTYPSKDECTPYTSQKGTS
jgi:hypothetical protein